MAGTLTISTLSDGTNSTSSTNCIQGSAKAWVNFNGTTGSIRTSYNISSVTRNTTGDYTIAFTTAFADANYSLSQGLNVDLNASAAMIANIKYGTVPSASSLTITTKADNGTSYDTTYVMLQFHR